MAPVTTPVVTQAQVPSTVEATVAELIAALQPINVEDKHQLSTKNIAERFNSLLALVQQMQPQQQVAVRDRGPKSEKDMTEDDARRVMLGDLKDASHKVAAETLGLSYGQVYSARKGFTFKPIYKEMMNGNKEPVQQAPAAE